MFHAKFSMTVDVNLCNSGPRSHITWCFNLYQIAFALHKEAMQLYTEEL